MLFVIGCDLWGERGGKKKREKRPIITHFLVDLVPDGKERRGGKGAFCRSVSTSLLS